jgi:hypothetical protein
MTHALHIAVHPRRPLTCSAPRAALTRPSAADQTGLRHITRLTQMLSVVRDPIGPRVQALPDLAPTLRLLATLAG